MDSAEERQCFAWIAQEKAVYFSLCKDNDSKKWQETLQKVASERGWDLRGGAKVGLIAPGWLWKGRFVVRLQRLKQPQQCLYCNYTADMCVLVLDQQTNTTQHLSYMSHHVLVAHSKRSSAD